GRVQRHRARASHRSARVHDLAGARPTLLPGSLRPRDDHHLPRRRRSGRSPPVERAGGRAGVTTIWVKPRAHNRADRAGDPLDGLVNMFDVGIVLAVAFLIAALEAHHLTQALIQKPTTTPSKKAQHSIVVPKKQKVVPLHPSGVKVP